MTISALGLVALRLNSAARGAVTTLPFISAARGAAW